MHFVYHSVKASLVHVAATDKYVCKLVPAYAAISAIFTASRCTEESVSHLLTVEVYALPAAILRYNDVGPHARNNLIAG